LKYVDDFKAMLDHACKPITKQILVYYYKKYNPDRKYLFEDQHPTSEWLGDSKPEIVKILEKLPFFQKFSRVRLMEMLEIMELKLLQPNEVLFFQRNQVYVVVSGAVLVKNHKNSM